MKTYSLLGAAALLIVGFLLYSSSKRIADLQRDLTSAQQQVAALEVKLAEASSRPVAANPEMGDKMELMRLRAELTALRREHSTLKQLSEIKEAKQANEESGKAPVLAGDEMLGYLTRTNSFVSHHDQEIVAALNQKHRELMVWWKALQQYADANNGYLPTQLADAQRFLPNDFAATLDISNFVRSGDGLDGSEGPPVHLPSVENPQKTVLFKERVPLILSDGRVCKTFLFADGNVMLFQE